MFTNDCIESFSFLNKYSIKFEAMNPHPPVIKKLRGRFVLVSWTDDSGITPTTAETSAMTCKQKKICVPFRAVSLFLLEKKNKEKEKKQSTPFCFVLF